MNGLLGVALVILAIVVVVLNSINNAKLAELTKNDEECAKDRADLHKHVEHLEQVLSDDENK